MLKGITFSPVGILIGAGCVEARLTDLAIEGCQSTVFGGQAYGNAAIPRRAAKAPFPTTEAERAQSGDPRRSLDERYDVPADADRLIPESSSSNVLLASE
jgi:hypothetical protein